MDECLQLDKYLEAFRIAEIWAQRGCDWAENCLGTLYHTGLGVGRDLLRARDFYDRAAKHGHGGAWYAMGVLYETGGNELPQVSPCRGTVMSARRNCAIFRANPASSMVSMRDRAS